MNSRISRNGGWRIGSVPGRPQHDLIKLGEFPDPNIDRNSVVIEWILQSIWLYKKTFTIVGDVQGRRLHLHFEGLDYDAEFFLNGKNLGSRIGMFTPIIFDL